MENSKIEKILAEMLEIRKTYASDAQFCKFVGLNPAQYSRIQKADYACVSQAKWYTIARKCNVNLKNAIVWHVVQTPAYAFIYGQMEHCQNSSISLMLCDYADIGKTETGRDYARKNNNAVYMDCSQSKSKQRLIRAIARAFGVDSTGKYLDVYDDLIYFINSQEIPPLVILDEAGDLEYSAFLELKALWNATEGACAWFMMGADGLKEKIRRAIDFKKVGYTEMYSRFGSKYQRVTPEATADREMFDKAQALLIIKANAPAGTDANRMIKATGGSLRRIKNEISKLQAHGSN